MTYPMSRAWSGIARLQNSQILAKSEFAERELDAVIDCKIDRIAANHAEADDPDEARRAIATAARSKRYRARLMRHYFVVSVSNNRSHFFTSDTDPSYAARQALTAIFAQTSPQDAMLLISVGQGGAPQAPGLTASAARKRLSRLRARFSQFNLHAG